MTLWTTVCGDEGKEADFVAWISRLLLENYQTGVKTFVEVAGPDVPFIRSEAVKALYEVLNVRQTHNIEFQSFFALM